MGKDKPKWYELGKKNRLANELTGRKTCGQVFVEDGKPKKCTRKPHSGGKHKA